VSQCHIVSKCVTSVLHDAKTTHVSNINVVGPRAPPPLSPPLSQRTKG
jgi:hypothetical protein